MREAFTHTLRHVLEAAQREARGRNQEFVGTEALFLAVVGCKDCEAELILRRLNLDLTALRETVLRGLPKGEEAPVITGDLPLTPKAQRIVQGAIVKAQALREPKITSRFLLLALVDEPHTLIREALTASGGDVNVLRQAMVESPSVDEE